MNCPNCGAVCEERGRFCGACGAALTIEKKGSHRVPIIIMLVLSIIGTCVFFATGGKLVPDPQDLPQMGGFLDQPYYIEDGVLSANYFVLSEEAVITVPGDFDGQTVTAIGDFSYLSCTGVYLPDTVTAIGESGFEGCDLLRGMDLPPALTSIGDYAFFDCVSLEAIHIPATVEYIGEDAFAYCDSLAFIFYDGTIAQWEDIFNQELSPETAVCCTDGTFYQD